MSQFDFSLFYFTTQMRPNYLNIRVGATILVLLSSSSKLRIQKFEWVGIRLILEAKRVGGWV